MQNFAREFGLAMDLWLVDRVTTGDTLIYNWFIDSSLIVDVIVVGGVGSAHLVSQRQSMLRRV